ncbi:MAG: rhomboid family intramembrane serine protease [Coprobacillus sp.]
MITNIYILICVAIFIYIQFISKDEKIYTALKLGAFYPPNVRENKEYYRFVLCNFIHIDFLHLLFNVYAMYYLGNMFESLLGTGQYIFLIVCSMLFSSLMCYTASQISDQHDRAITLGASGTVYGFFGAIVALGLLLGGVYMELLQNYMNVILINIMYTLFNRQISKTGHLGGFVGGIVGIVCILAMNKFL